MHDDETEATLTLTLTLTLLLEKQDTVLCRYATEKHIPPHVLVYMDTV
jgi:hypothetical protein